MKAKRVFTEGEVVEIRRLPGDKHWERATYVCRVKQEEMPPLWRGPLGHYVRLGARDGNRITQISCQRIRKAQVIG